MSPATVGPARAALPRRIESRGQAWFPIPAESVLIRPDSPSDESARLEALRSYAVLDTPPERAFDDLTQLASQLCGTPMSLVSLVDEGRQWFKSHTGLDVTETPREVAFCAHAILQPGELLIVPDAHADERFHDNPLVRQEPHVRFYAGVPLVNPDGHALGTLCVMDHVPRTLDEVQLTALRVLGRQVGTQLELRKKVTDLEAATCSVEAATAVKAAFLANISHEIRTPMNAILGMAELLHETPLSAEQAQYVGVFHSAGQALLDLINGILDLSQVEAGKFELASEPFELRAFLETVIEGLALSACRKGLGLALEIDPGVPETVLGDAKRLRQVLVNLLGNAIKFTEQGHVVVHVSRDERISFAVRDTGIGIAPEDTVRIFQSFTQVDAGSDRRYGGTGLGLSLCERLVEPMGGTIGVQSVPGEGSTFSVELPLTIVREDRVPANRTTAGRRILVVDDCDPERTALRHGLERLGCEVSEAGGGLEGLALWGQARSTHQPHDMVLLDVRMPTPSGLEVVRRIAEAGGDLRRIVLLLPADFRHRDLAHAKELGVGGCLAKPVREERLAEVLEAVLDGRSAPDPGQRRQEAPRARPDAPLRILLVEDLPENRFLARAYLADGGHWITYAEDGVEGVRAFKEGTFDIVLMDMQLPRMDGYTATRTVRDWERERGRPRTPILALTADAMESDRARALEAGCDGHLTKPLSKCALLEALGEYAVRAPAAADIPDLDAVPAPIPTAVRTPDSAVAVDFSTSGEDAADAIAALRPVYVRSRRSDLTTLMAAADAEDLQTIRRIAHNIKGTGASFGFPELTQLGASMQAAAEEGDLVAARRDIDSYRSRLDDLHDPEDPSGAQP